MKFSVRTPSIKKRISSRTSLKRYARHSLGLKAPRGMGVITDPKRALYNRVYNRTTVSVDRLAKARNSASKRLGTKTSKTTLARPQAAFMHQRLSSLTLWMYKHSNNINQARAYVAESVRCFHKDDFQNALKLAKQAHSADPNNVAALYLIGTCSNNLGDAKTAVSHLEPYVSRAYDDLNARYALGIAYLNTGQYEDAKEIAKGLLLTLGDHIEALRLLGVANFKRGDYTNAIGVLKRAPLHKQIDSETLLDIHYWLGCAYERSGDKKNAHEEYQRVREVNSGYRDVLEASKRTV